MSEDEWNDDQFNEFNLTSTKTLPIKVKTKTTKKIMTEKSENKNEEEVFKKPTKRAPRVLQPRAASLSENRIKPSENKEEKLTTNGETKSRKNSGGKKMKLSSPNISKQSVLANKETADVDWTKLFNPKQLSDLPVNQKKLDEIRDWVLDAGCFLLIVGPPGCCKLSAARIIATEAGYDVSEFKLSNDGDSLNDSFTRKHGYQKQSDKLANFLLTSARYRSLVRRKPRLLIVKEFPNVFLRKGSNETFWTILRKVKFHSNAPVIFISTETPLDTTSIEFKLFPDEIREELEIDVIRMNAVTQTAVKKILKQVLLAISDKENLEICFADPPQSIIDAIAFRSQGDMRSAVHNLQIFCQNGTIDLSKKTIKSKPKKSPRRSPKRSTDLGKDAKIELFHAVGRVMYPKLELNPVSKRQQLVNSPEDLAEIFKYHSKKFLELVNSNYNKHFLNLRDFANMADIFSRSDVFQNEHRESARLHEVNFTMVLRGGMILNRFVQRGKFQPIRGVTRNKFKHVADNNTKKYLNQFTKYTGGHRIPKKEFCLDYISLLSIIKPESEIPEKQREEEELIIV